MLSRMSGIQIFVRILEKKFKNIKIESGRPDLSSFAREMPFHCVMACYWTEEAAEVLDSLPFALAVLWAACFPFFDVVKQNISF